jgi:hypothetical protein
MSANQETLMEASSSKSGHTINHGNSPLPSEIGSTFLLAFQLFTQLSSHHKKFLNNSSMELGSNFIFRNSKY